MAAKISNGQTYAIFNPVTCRFLDVSGGSYNWSTPIINWAGHLDASPQNQIFMASQGQNGYFFLINIKTGLCIDITASDKSNGAAIIQYPQHGGFPNNQLWSFVSAGGSGETPQFFIKNSYTNTAITVKNDQTSTKYQVSAWSLGGPAPDYYQKWVMVPMSGSFYLPRSTLWSGLSQSVSSVWSCFGGQQKPEQKLLTAPTYGESGRWEPYEARRSTVMDSRDGKWEEEKYSDEN